MGTALPETMIPHRGDPVREAGADGDGRRDGVGVGAILGAPFMLATLAMFVTGVAVVAARAATRATGDRMPVDTEVLGKDVGVLLRRLRGSRSARRSCRRTPDSLRLGVAVVLLVIYAIYVRAHFVADPDVRCRRPGAAAVPPAGRARTARVEPDGPRLRIVNRPGARRRSGSSSAARSSFVDAVERPGDEPRRRRRSILALVIAPIATELPEKFNSIIWVRPGKDTLAMGNITGAMVFQSCIPTVVGLVFAADTWQIDLSSPESRAGVRVGGHRVRCRRRPSSLPMVRRRPAAPAAGCSWAARFYVAYLALVAGPGAVGLPRARLERVGILAAPC